MPGPLFMACSREPWLAEPGQVLSLQTVLDYLARAFAMKPSEHIHFGGIVYGLSLHFVAKNLTTVREWAQRICAALTSERHNYPERAAP